MEKMDLTKSILEFLRKNGETCTTNINLPDVKRSTLISKLSRMFTVGKLNRRLLPTPRGPMWAYSANVEDPKFLFGEPDYVYYLRNLGGGSEVRNP
jgi:hypothetical protein